MESPTFVQCNACGGIFRPVQADGCAYYHVCPDTRVTGSRPAPTLEAPTATTPIVEPIASRRNENIRVDPETGDVSIISAGAGVTPVTDPTTLAALTTHSGV